MPCHYPKYARGSQLVSCGVCQHCRFKYSYEWAVRCSHEASLYTHNCFITLTYDDKRLPSGYDIRQGLVYDHFQQFMKDFRSECCGFDAVPFYNAGKINKKTGFPWPDFYRPIRFYVAGEYGEKRGRPHFHACIFNFDFSDKYFWRFSKAKSPHGKGHKIYRSPTLERLWPYGNSEMGAVTFESAGYCARYIHKKVLGVSGDTLYDDAYSWRDDDGVLHYRSPEFAEMSRKPGIASGWFDKYHTDVFPHDRVVVRGRPRPVPRYYDKKFSLMTGFMNPITFDSETGEIVEQWCSPELDNIKDARVKRVKDFLDRNPPPSSISSQLLTQRIVDSLPRNLK